MGVSDALVLIGVSFVHYFACSVVPLTEAPPFVPVVVGGGGSAHSVGRRMITDFEFCLSFVFLRNFIKNRCWGSIFCSLFFL